LAVTQAADASGDWDSFVMDAAHVLPYIDELHATAPALIQEPFNPAFQDRMREILGTDRVAEANAAARRIGCAKHGPEAT
jgi:hypothetical protein